MGIGPSICERPLLPTLFPGGWGQGIPLGCQHLNHLKELASSLHGSVPKLQHTPKIWAVPAMLTVEVGTTPGPARGGLQYSLSPSEVHIVELTGFI